MQRRSENRARGFLSRGALLSLLLHGLTVGPVGLTAWILGSREEARRAEEVDVAFEDVSNAELPKDLPPIESPPPDLLTPPAPKPKPEERKRKPLAQEEQKEQKEKKKEADKKPEPEVVVPPLPPMPEPPKPPPPERKAHEKLVDLDNDKDVPPPPDAKYLAQKNNRAEVETRATDTNLEKNQKGEKASPSAPSQREDTEVGGEKQKIAELEDQKSALGRSAPEVTPHANPQVASPKDRAEPDKRSLLALRDPAPKTHELTPETADLSLPRQPDGDLAMPDRAVRGKKSDPARLPPGKRVKLAITGEDYEYVFGADAEAERRLAQKQRSMKVGKHLAKLAHAQSPLENFIPEVKPGNQTALNTRAAPFAAYIARMHRSIHKLWGFGALEDWDELSGSSPLNNPALMTELEIVLNRDGTIDKVGIVRTSGLSEYDSAAMDVAYSAGPYPDPPREIRSGNGKIYVHWRFYRDERQCATSGVDYFILENAPKGGDDPDSQSAAPSLGGPPTASAPTPVPASPTPAGGPIASGSPGGSPLAPAAAQGTTTGNGGLRRLRRFDGRGHRAGLERLEQEVAAAEQREGGGEKAPAEPAASPARAADPGARAAAERWFGALAAGDAKTLAAMATLPFKTGGKEVSKRAALETMLADLVQEGEGGRALGVQVFTAAGLRAAIGRLPPNLEDGGGAQLYAIAGATDARDPLVLILSQRGGLWRPVGLVRR
jgi:TonB family protein